MENKDFKAQALLADLEKTGKQMKQLKKEFREYCLSAEMISGSKVLQLYEQIESIQEEYYEYDLELTLIESEY